MPKKNIRNLCGQPLISWTVDAALKSKFIDQVVVNSDSDEILGIAAGEGVVADKRDQALATDTASSIDVALDLLKRFDSFDILVWLQPTSPLRNERHIDEALELLCDTKASSVVSVAKASHPPAWVNVLDESGGLSRFCSSQVANKRSQDLGEYYRLNGAIYISLIDTIKVNKKFVDTTSRAYIMSDFDSVDIDTLLDFKFAEFLLQDRVHSNA